MIFVIIASVCIVLALLYSCCKFFDAILKAVCWFAFKLPAAIVVATIGFVLCATIIFLPLGASLLSTAASIVF